MTADVVTQHQTPWDRHLLPSVGVPMRAGSLQGHSPWLQILALHFLFCDPMQATKLLHAKFPHLLKGANYTINLIGSQATAIEMVHTGT